MLAPQSQIMHILALGVPLRFCMFLPGEIGAKPRSSHFSIPFRVAKMRRISVCLFDLPISLSHMELPKWEEGFQWFVFWVKAGKPGWPLGKKTSGGSYESLSWNMHDLVCLGFRNRLPLNAKHMGGHQNATLLWCCVVPVASGGPLGDPGPPPDPVGLWSVSQIYGYSLHHLHTSPYCFHHARESHIIISHWQLHNIHTISPKIINMGSKRCAANQPSCNGSYNHSCLLISVQTALMVNRVKMLKPIKGVESFAFDLL